MTEIERTFEPPSTDPLLAAVGRGIQAFVMVESGLAFVFASIVQPADRATAVLAMNAAWQLDTKLRMVRAVAEFKLTGKLLDRVNAALDDCRKKGGIRHKLAHYMVGLWPGAASVAEMKKMRPALLPPITSTLHGRVVWGGETPLQLNEIEHFVEQCNELFATLADLSNEIPSA
ncbi:hypothetical protein ACVWZK_005487 [Bradyrhizobium sp. GM0.4]